MASSCFISLNIVAKAMFASKKMPLIIRLKTVHFLLAQIVVLSGTLIPRTVMADMILINLMLSS